MRAFRTWFKRGLIAVIVWYGLAGRGWGQETVLVNFNAAQHTMPPGWEWFVHQGKAHLQLVPVITAHALQMRTDNTSFALQRQRRIPLKQTPFLVWQWKGTQLPASGDSRHGQTGDQVP